MKKKLLFIGWVLVTLAAFAQPMRIVSTSPSITETLFALGVGNRVVGVSTYCRYPPEVLRLPKVGTYARPDPEKIALLRPGSGHHSFRVRHAFRPIDSAGYSDSSR